MNTLFNNEDEEDKLRTLKTTKGRKTKLKNHQAYCQVNVSSSWFFGCDGKMVPLERQTNRTRDIFHLQWWSGAYYIRVRIGLVFFVSLQNRRLRLIELLALC